MTSPKPPAISEKVWSQQFAHLFATFGWHGYHPWLSVYSDRGFPDWVLCNEAQRRIIFVELKTEAGKLSAKQELWRDRLLACGQEWYCWRPSQFDAAAAVLRGKAPKGEI